ncbi:hypothetical protein ABZX75_01155 [Streptomyces sp. NPDC003038]|uniref:hypothetical protein n=1 Tax=unclassified Streptomyces TaxID=2593676 RepID=UPI0033A0A81E
MVRQAKDGKPYLVGVKEFAALYGVRPLQVSQWISRDKRLDYEYARIISGSPYWLLDFAKRYGTTTPRPKQLDEAVLQRLVEEQQPGYWESRVEDLPALVGQSEIAVLFGLSDSAGARNAAKTGRLRPADYTLSGSPIWLLEPLLEDAPALKASARGGGWAINENVRDALLAGTYDGHGSRIIPRGPGAAKDAG